MWYDDWASARHLSSVNVIMTCLWKGTAGKEKEGKNLNGHSKPSVDQKRISTPLNNENIKKKVEGSNFMKSCLLLSKSFKMHY